MTEPTQRHTNVPRCQHTHNNHQCQLDAGHDDSIGSLCVYTTISAEPNGDTITRFNHHEATTLNMPNRGSQFLTKQDRTTCIICGSEVERRIHKYCSDKCRREARRMQKFRASQQRRQNAA